MHIKHIGRAGLKGHFRQTSHSASQPELCITAHPLISPLRVRYDNSRISQTTLDHSAMTPASLRFHSQVSTAILACNTKEITHIITSAPHTTSPPHLRHSLTDCAKNHWNTLIIPSPSTIIRDLRTRRGPAAVNNVVLIIARIQRHSVLLTRV